MRESSHPPARRRPPFILCWDVDGYFRFIFGESGATEHNRARWMAAAHANPLIKRAAIFSLPQHCAMCARRRVFAQLAQNSCELLLATRRGYATRETLNPTRLHTHSASFCMQHSDFSLLKFNEQIMTTVKERKIPTFPCCSL